MGVIGTFDISFNTLERLGVKGVDVFSSIIMINENPKIPLFYSIMNVLQSYVGPCIYQESFAVDNNETPCLC